MILLLAHAALAASCCTSAGTQPTVLDSCDALGVAFGLGGDVAYGGWGWSGAWSPAGDDGGGSAVGSVAILGRFTPWLQGGLRVPVRVAFERLDGEVRADTGLGSALLWIDAEAPRRGSRSPRVGVALGLGTEGASASASGATVLQAGVRATHTAARWSVWGTASGRAPVLGHASVDGDAAVVVDRELGPRTRLGVGVSGLAAKGTAPSYALAVGPSLVLAPNHTDRVVIGVQAGLPVDHGGRNAPSRVLVSLDAYRVLASVPTSAAQP